MKLSKEQMGLVRKERAATGLSWSFTILGPPRTKKNHGKRLQRGDQLLQVPSDAYMAWNTHAIVQLKNQKRGVIRDNLNCRAMFFRHALVGDAVGFYQGLADTLQDAGVIEDDAQIVAWDGTRLKKDSVNPRVELTLDLLIDP